MKTLIRMGAIALLALLASPAVRAQLTLQPTVSFLSGTFQYSYQVANPTATDVSIVTLSGLFPASDAVFGLTAPAGFLALFDPGLSLLSFFEDTQSFAAGQTSDAFTFSSIYAPTSGTFEAIDLNGGLFIGETLVPGGLATSAVPEPATTAVFGALALIGIAFHRKIFVPQKSQS
jgi:hypothetical protein